MDSASSKLPERSLLGFFAHPGTLEEYLNLLKTSIEKREPCTIFYHNLHSLYSYLSSESLRKFYEGTTVLVDGMPVIWLYKLAGAPLSRQHRITYVDFILPMMKMAKDNGWKVYHLGQSADIQQQALEIIREKVPGIQIEGHDGYFDQDPQSDESLEVIKGVNDFGTNLLLVGFGAPRQEAWLHAHRDQIDAQAALTCGACMEYVAGAVKTPPRWMGQFGLEWSFRLLENPRRFAFRYLVEPILLAGMLARNWLLARLGSGKQAGATAGPKSKP